MRFSSNEGACSYGEPQQGCLLAMRTMRALRAMRASAVLSLATRILALACSIWA